MKAWSWMEIERAVMHSKYLDYEVMYCWPVTAGRRARQHYALPSAGGFHDHRHSCYCAVQLSFVFEARVLIHAAVSSCEAPDLKLSCFSYIFNDAFGLRRRMMLMNIVYRWIFVSSACLDWTATIAASRRRHQNCLAQSELSFVESWSATPRPRSAPCARLPLELSACCAPHSPSRTAAAATPLYRFGTASLAAGRGPATAA